MNQVLIEHLDPTAWTAKPPGKARTIAAIFTHMHNVRSKWVRLTAPHLKVPPQLNRAHCTPQQARAGLAESAASCAEMLAEALGGRGGRVEKFRRDGWAPPWPVGVEMLERVRVAWRPRPRLLRNRSTAQAPGNTGTSPRSLISRLRHIGAATHRHQ